VSDHSYRVNLKSAIGGCFACCALIITGACGFGLSDDELMTRARVSSESGEHRAAMIDLKSLLQRSPGDAEARFALGNAYLALGDPQAAEKEFRRAAEYGIPQRDLMVPLGRALLEQQSYAVILREIIDEQTLPAGERAAVLILRGDAEFGLGRPLEGRELYVAALEIDPENSTAYLGMAATYIAGGEFSLAEQMFDRAIESDPLSSAAWMARGTYRLSQRALSAATVDLQRAFELTEAGGDLNLKKSVLTGLTDVYVLQDDLDAARNASQQLNALAPGSVTARYAAARVAFASGDYDASVVLLQGILRDAPEFRRAYFLLGAVHRMIGNLAQAEMYLASAVLNLPNNDEARRLLADVRIRQSKPREASETIAPLLYGEDADADLLAAAGMIKLQLGDTEEAVSLIERSSASSPGDAERKMDLAAVYLAVGNIQQAVQILDSLAQEGIDEGRFDVLLVIAEQRQNGTSAAIAQAERLIEDSDGNTRLEAVLGALYQSIGDTVSARRAYDKALAADFTSVAALLGLGRLAGDAQRFDEARSHIRRVLQIEPGNIPAMLELARIANRVGDTAEAISWLEKARTINPVALMPRLLLTSQYLLQQRYDESRIVAEEALRIAPDHAGALNALGVVQLVSGNESAAASLLSRAVRLAPENAAYRFNNARAQIALGDSVGAIRALETSYADNPDHFPTALAVAMLRLKNDDATGALTIAEDLQRRFPDRAAGYSLLGEIQAYRDRFAAAAAAYDKALALEPSRKVATRAVQARLRSQHGDPYTPLVAYLGVNPDDVQARTTLAQIYHSNGLISAAASEYERVIQADDDNAVALNNLSLILADREDSRAVDLAAAAYNLLPENPAVADTYGWILFRAGRTDEALNVLRQAALALPSDGDINYHFGVALAEVGLIAEARDFLERAVSTSGHFDNREPAEELFSRLRNEQ
jgi:putative PEP-CTERM system TPR-repeat lipoprotein